MSTFLDKMAEFDARKGRTQTWDPTRIEGAPIPVPDPPNAAPILSAKDLYGEPADQDMAALSQKPAPETPVDASGMPQDGLRGVAQVEASSKPDLIVLGHAAEVAGHGVVLMPKEVAQIKSVVIKAVERVMAETKASLAKDLPKRGRRKGSDQKPLLVDRKALEAGQLVPAEAPVKRKRGRPRKVQP